jgi:hypothetical protein
MNEARVTKPVDPATRAKLLFIVRQRGEAKVLQEIGISRMALNRVLSGLNVYGGTRIAVDAYVQAQ